MIEMNVPKTEKAQKAVQQTGHRGWIIDKNLSWATERETQVVEHKGKTQRGEWMWPEPAKGCQRGQTERIRGARGI